MIGRTEVDLPRCEFHKARAHQLGTGKKVVTRHSQSFIPISGDQTVASNETRQFANGQSALMVATVPRNLTFAWATRTPLSAGTYLRSKESR